MVLFNDLSFKQQLTKDKIVGMASPLQTDDGIRRD